MKEALHCLKVSWPSLFLQQRISTSAFLVIQSIQTGNKIQKRIVAAHLAQEGVEVIRNIRDSNWLSGSNWTANINTAGIAGCVDYDDSSIDMSCAVGGIFF